MIDQDDETIAGIIVPSSRFDIGIAGIDDFATAETCQHVGPLGIKRRDGQVIGHESDIKGERDRTPLAVAMFKDSR